MLTMKRPPKNIPLDSDNSINDVIQDFINQMQTITGGKVELDYDLEGNITIYFEEELHKPIINKNKLQQAITRPYIDFDVLYHGDYVKSLFMSDSEPATDFSIFVDLGFLNILLASLATLGDVCFGFFAAIILMN